MGHVGIKETKDLVIALNELTLLLVSCFKDGANVDSFLVLWKSLMENQDLRNKIKEAYDNYKLVPSEMADLDVVESMDLAMTQLAYISKISKALQRGEV